MSGWQPSGMADSNLEKTYLIKTEYWKKRFGGRWKSWNIF